MSPTHALRTMRALDQRSLQLQVVQPALIGLIDGTITTLAPILCAAYVSRSRAALIDVIDGTISTLAPIFATAYVSGSRPALLVGLAAGLGPACRSGLR